MTRRRAVVYPAVQPVADMHEVVLSGLTSLIRSALADAGKDVESGYDYQSSRNTRDAGRARSKKLREIRDQFELAMAGVTLEDINDA